MKIYIVTVHLNNPSGFVKTAQSLRSFLMIFRHWKWIIKDGGSSEDVMNEIQKHLYSFPDDMYALIQKNDNGIYDAMNQSVEIIDENNSYCLFLNAGDYFTHEFSLNFCKILENTDNADILYGDHYQIKNRSLALQKSPKEIDFAYLLGKTINHQSLMIKLKWLKKYPFQTDYKVVADWVQLFSIMKYENIRAEYFNVPFVVYEGGGYSEVNDKLRIEEKKLFLESVYSEWELKSLLPLSRLKTKRWFPLILKSLDSPRRSALLDFISKFL